ncbi:MAG: metalloregulator ArsR/SmtB family transcription factor [Gammaproteobacteria bacterium]|nr:metalloregulator ArsR/SmtB family transcription factor [Gammaproteobacteria bacterium]
MNITPVTLFSLLSHETRLRSVLMLREHAELCVCELTAVLDAPQPHVSRHLAQLREAGLLVDRRQGQWIYYRINPDLPDWIQTLLTQAASQVAAFEPYATDLRVLGEGLVTRSNCPV